MRLWSVITKWVMLGVCVQAGGTLKASAAVYDGIDFQQRALMRRLDRQCIPAHELNQIFSRGVALGQYPLLTFMMNGKYIKPTQKGFVYALREARQQNNTGAISYLLKASSDYLRDDNHSIDVTFSWAVRGGYVDLINQLLTPSPNHPLPSQAVVDRDFVSAFQNKRRLVIVGLLRDRPEGQLRASDVALDDALRLIVNECRTNRLPILMEGPPSQRRPSPHAVMEATQLALNQRNPSMYHALTPYVGVDFHGRRPAHPASEVHIYADYKVEGTPSKGGKPQQVKLVDAVFEHITQRLMGQPLMTVDAAKQKLKEAINAQYAEPQRQQAHDAVFYRLPGDLEYNRHLCDVVMFLNTFHPQAFSLWVGGFVTESITAYKSKDNPSSCTKGIRERMATGLRMIDEALDVIFVKAEGPALARAFFNNTCMFLGDPQKEEWMAKDLVNHGLTSADPTPVEAKGVFEVGSHKRLREWGIPEDNQEFKEIVSAYGELVEDNFDAALKPRVKRIRMAVPPPEERA